MNKREFFIAAMKAGRLADKRWVFAAFSLLRPNPRGFEGMKPWDILYVTPDDHNGRYIVFIDDNGNPIELSDYEYDVKDPMPPYRFKDKVKVGPDDMENVVGDAITTTYGNLVANWLLCVYPFGSKIPYIEGRFGIGHVEKIIEKKLVSDPAPGTDRDPKVLYVDEYNRYRRGAGLIDGFTQLCVPSATAKSMTRHPDTEKVRNELLEKYKDRLHDPAVVAKIDAELKALDLEWLKDDESMGFYIKGKSLNVVRKKAHLMVGYESAFSEGGEGEVLPNSLSEGIDVSRMPIMANVLREGSYDRGASTALGGEAVKFILRVMQNSKITEVDCGSKLGILMRVTKDNRDEMVGNNILERGKVVQLTDENIGAYDGKVVEMRTPLFCRTEKSNFCETCVGGRYAEHKNGLASAASGVGSTLMLTFMGAMHGVELKTVKMDLATALT